MSEKYYTDKSYDKLKEQLLEQLESMSLRDLSLRDFSSWTLMGSLGSRSHIKIVRQRLTRR